MTVPIEARAALGLTAGTEVEFVLRESEIVLRKGTKADDPVDRIYGVLRLLRSPDRLLEEMRGRGLVQTSPARRRLAKPQRTRRK